MPVGRRNTYEVGSALTCRRVVDKVLGTASAMCC